MALNSLFCADVPLSNYSLSRGNGGFYRQLREVGLEVMCVCVCVTHLWQNYEEECSKLLFQQLTVEDHGSHVDK